MFNLDEAIGECASRVSCEGCVYRNKECKEWLCEDELYKEHLPFSKEQPYKLRLYFEGKLIPQKVENNFTNSDGDYNGKSPHYKHWRRLQYTAYKHNIKVCDAWLEYQNFAWFLEINDLVDKNFKFDTNVKLLDKNSIIC